MEIKKAKKCKYCNGLNCDPIYAMTDYCCADCFARSHNQKESKIPIVIMATEAFRDV